MSRKGSQGLSSLMGAQGGLSSMATDRHCLSEAVECNHACGLVAAPVEPGGGEALSVKPAPQPGEDQRQVQGRGWRARRTARPMDGPLNQPYPAKQNDVAPAAHWLSICIPVLRASSPRLAWRWSTKAGRWNVRPGRPGQGCHKPVAMSTRCG